jgi:hypothetical protein
MKRHSIYGMLLQSWSPIERPALMPGKNPSRKLEEGKSSRLGEVIHILNTSVEDSFAEEMLSAEKGVRRKKTSLVKRTSRL